MTTAFLILAALLSASVLFRSLHLGLSQLVYAAKPLTVVSIGLIALFAGPTVSLRYQQLILAGLAISLIGDVFLMLPRDRFIPGLISFLIAHLLYIAAFVGRLDGLPILPFVPYIVALIFVTTLLWKHLGSLRIPVLVYSGTLALMAGAAFGVAMSLGGLTAWSAAIGATLFVLSDTALAFDRFIGHFGSAQYIILSTYFAAQLLIALSVFA